MTHPDYRFSTLEQFVDSIIGRTEWLVLEQARIAAFAECTDDRQWIHLDHERAARETPQRTTIAHGLLTLSLLPRFSYEVGLLPTDASHALNYGFDKVRFIAPVPSGARVRDVLRLQSVVRKATGQALIEVVHTVEIEGSDKPALVASALSLVFAAAGSGVAA
ncbi:MAG: MaoC family dehydratase [Chitinophagaceae bacterium]|nr:MaoC family dehydratase [Rubrivivax sp.]